MRFTSAFITTLLFALTALAIYPYAGYRSTADLAYTEVAASVKLPEVWLNECSAEGAAFVGLGIGNPLTCHGGINGGSVEVGVMVSCGKENYSFKTGYQPYWVVYPGRVQYIQMPDGTAITAGQTVRLRIWTHEEAMIKVSIATEDFPLTEVEVGSLWTISNCVNTAACFFRAGRTPDNQELLPIPGFEAIHFTDVWLSERSASRGLHGATPLVMRDSIEQIWAHPFPGSIQPVTHEFDSFVIL